MAEHRQDRVGLLTTAFALALACGTVCPTFAGPVPNPAWGPRLVTDLRPSAPEIELVLDPARPEQCLTLAAPSTLDRNGIGFVRSANDSIVGVCDDGRVRVVAGEPYAYAFLKPIAAGETTISVGGESVRVRVVKQSAEIEAALRTRAFGEMPAVLGPSAGAGVWGEMTVALGWWRSDTGDDRVLLRVSDGVVTNDIAPTWVSDRARGPFALAACRVDFGACTPGDCTLRVVRKIGEREIVGEPVTVRVVALKTDDVAILECETDHGQLAPNAWGPPKPPAVQKEAGASGGAFFANNAAEPRLRVPIVVDEQAGAGWYQVMLTCAGDESAGAMPSVGLTLDDAQRPISASAIAMPTWHRVAIGTPMRLEAGRHTLRLDFMNDFAVSRSDRNLKLDRVEIARVADAGGKTPAATAPGAMSAMSATDNAPAMASMTNAGEMAGDGGGMMGMGSSTDTPKGESVWPATVGGPRVRVAFERPLDGTIAMGEMEIRGLTWWPGQQKPLAEAGDPPRVSLVVNGRIVQTQRTDAPRFVITPDALVAGANTVQLVAERGGTVSSTAVQNVFAPAESATGSHAGNARESIRLTVHEPAWPKTLREGLRDGQGGEQRFSAPLASSSRIRVELPEKLEGEFDVYLEGRSAGSKPQRVDVLVDSTATDQNDMATGPAGVMAGGTLPNWYAAHRLTAIDAPGVTLRRGSKRLLLDIPDARGGWVTDKNPRTAAWVQAVRLVERPHQSDTSGPVVNVLHPRDGERVFGADAIVAEVADASAVTGVEVVIDGTPTGLVHDLSEMHGFGRVVAPVLLRGVPAGERRIALRVVDARGNITTTPDRRVNVLPSEPNEPTLYRRGVTLLNRVAYGPEAQELADVLRLGIDGYLADRLGRSAGTGAPDAGERAALEEGEVRFANGRSGYDVPRRAIQQAIVSTNPVRTRLVLWEQNHFSTWVRKTEAWRKMDEHEAFSRVGAARFGDLLRLSATSPAMLRYLDQERSFSGRLNENYAREIMELHTLGVHGGYEQKDVTNLAHVLTGWTTARGALAGGSELTADDDGLADDFRTEPRAGSELKEPRVVFGAEFDTDMPEDRHTRVLRAIEMLANHPKTAQYVCGKLAAHYTQNPPDETLVAAMSATFARTGGDLRAVVSTMATHPAFWAAASTPRLAHPLDYALRLSRTTGANSPWDVGDFLAASGQGMFDRPTPDGYPEADAEGMDSNAMLQRWKLAGKADGVIAGAVPPSLRWNDQPLEKPATPDAPDGSSDGTPAPNADAQRIVDLIAVRLTGFPLSPASNQSALSVLVRSAPALPARPEHWQRDARIRTVGTFIAQLPETNLK